MRIELHCHSTHSDGSHGAAEVARLAAEREVALFCLTDHDTVDGYEATTHELHGTHVLRGMELSCRQHDRGIHVLVYGIQGGPALASLTGTLVELRAQRRARVFRICERLATLGVTLDADAIVDGVGDRTLGRPHVARALVKAKVVTSVREAFTRFLKDGGPADVPSPKLSVAEGLELGRSVGAKMSLAHPHTLGEPALVADLFKRNRDAGLEGIEAWYGTYAEAERRPWLGLAEDLDLVVTGGSDFHGDVLPTVSRPGIDLPERYARPLCDWLGVSLATR